jgi:YD repeat-containing protein
MEVMLDPLTSTAFAIHNGKGVYALLLGSGISRAANVPTGWEVTLDLIRRIAAMRSQTEQCDADPEGWFRANFRCEPSYSDLLEHLATSPAERASALARYFEPGEDEDGPAAKPTAAHVAIAKMVKRGYFRVLLTTNFDRLLERALEAEGVSPSILSTPDAVHGAMPLAHSACTIIKLHGDGQVMEPNSASTSYIYDALGNLITVNQPGLAGETHRSPRGFIYDSLSRLTSATNPETGTIGYIYDANGNVTSKTDARGVATGDLYDALNRLTSKSSAGGSGVPGFNYGYAYDTPTTGTGRSRSCRSGRSYCNANS